MKICNFVKIEVIKTKKVPIKIMVKIKMVYENKVIVLNKFARLAAPWLPLCVLYLIRACWVEISENNMRVFDTIIRHTRVIYSVMTQAKHCRAM